MQTIYFFTSKSELGALAFGTVSALYPHALWRRFQIVDSQERSAFDTQTHNPDLIISFLNPFILPNPLLEAVGKRAFNIHPATPSYPGRDPQHFAFYEGATVVGATLHRMNARVDNGEILDVLETPIDRSLGVLHFIECSGQLSLALLIKNLPSLFDNSIEPRGLWQWRSAAKRSRQDFQKMCRLDFSMSREEVMRRIEAFYHPAYRNLYLELYNYRFTYDPSAQ